jgi:hypothetical protein
MGRSAKYKTADDLLDNTVVRNDCLVWPDSACLMPSLGPASPMAKTFGTTSVIRILFTIVRYPPGGRRLVRFCSSPFCINPFHFAEAKKYRNQRKELLDPHGLLPSQESTRHLAAPPDDYLAALFPRKPEHVRFLAETAARAGLDGKGLRPADKKLPQVTTINAVYADPEKPLFKMRGRPKKAAPDLTDLGVPTSYPNDATNALEMDDEENSGDTGNTGHAEGVQNLDANLRELTDALGPTTPHVDRSPHPLDFGRNPETNKPLTLRQILARK